jgi:hypothetical protein
MRPMRAYKRGRRIRVDLAAAVALTCLSALAGVAAEPEPAAHVTRLK